MIRGDSVDIRMADGIGLRPLIKMIMESNLILDINIQFSLLEHLCLFMEVGVKILRKSLNLMFLKQTKVFGQSMNVNRDIGMDYGYLIQLYMFLEVSRGFTQLFQLTLW